MKRLAVVVPSIRPDQMRAFFDAWAEQDYPADWRIVWDLEQIPDDINLFTNFGITAFNQTAHNEIIFDLGQQQWIIPHKTAAVRSYGILQAFRAGADYIACLDDDVLPSGPDHLRRLVAALEAPVQSEWVGIGPQKQRGIPFELGRRPVALHEGGWWNVPDLDAPTQLAAGIDPAYRADRALGQMVVAPGQWLALSAMHMVFRREFAPAMYQLLMGEGWPYHRFDDVWSGMFAKKIADHLGLAVSYGSPQVEHRRASDVYASLVAEAPGIREHEARWRDIAALPVEGDCAACAYRSLAVSIKVGMEGDYWQKLAEAMAIWAGLFGCLSERPPMERRIEEEIAAEEAQRSMVMVLKRANGGTCREIVQITPSITGECGLPAGHEGQHHFVPEHTISIRSGGRCPSESEYRLLDMMVRCELSEGHAGKHTHTHGLHRLNWGQEPAFTVYRGDGTSHEAPADAVKEAVG